MYSKHKELRTHFRKNSTLILVSLTQAGMKVRACLHCQQALLWGRRDRRMTFQRTRITKDECAFPQKMHA